jgi:hypothetical protein
MGIKSELIVLSNGMSSHQPCQPRTSPDATPPIRDIARKMLGVIMLAALDSGHDTIN